MVSPLRPLVAHGRIAAFADCGGAVQRRFASDLFINDIMPEMNTDNGSLHSSTGKQLSWVL